MITKNYNFKEEIKNYIKHITVRNYSKQTIKNYERILLQFNEELELNDVADDENHFVRFFEDYILSFFNKDMSAGYCYQILIVVRNLLQYMGITHLDSFEPIKRPKTIPKPLNEEQLFDLFHSVQYNTETDSEAYLNRAMRDELILYFFYATGVRVSELCNIKLEDLNFNDNTLKINKGKGDKERIVIFDKITSKILNNYLKHRTVKSRYLFPNNNTGNKLTSRAIQKICKKYGKKCGLKVTPHMLRHSFATNLHIKGMSLRYIQTLMGHESIATTQIYTKVDLNDLKHEYNHLK